MAVKKAGSWSASENRLNKNGDHLEGMENGQKKVPEGIQMPKLDIQTMELSIVGDTELIVHRWSQKAQREMLQKQMGIAHAGKEKKNPTEDFLATLYTMEQGKLTGTFDSSLENTDPEGHPNVRIKGGKYGFPVIAFKNAAVTACTSLGKDITKVSARLAFHVDGVLATIEGEPRMRQDMVRLNGMTSDIRHRAGFPEWKAKLIVRFNARALSQGQVINLFQTAGFAVGVGEWRPEKDGSYGRFHVE